MSGVTIRKIKQRFKVIENEVSNLVEDKYIFDTYKEYIKNSKNIDKESDFLFFIAKNYQLQALMNICKQADEHVRSESLINLLKDIKKNDHLFTLNWFINKYPERLKGNGAEDFKTFSIKNNSRISKAKVDKDIKEIKRTIKGLKFGAKRQSISSLYKFRNKRGAHFDKGKPRINVPIAQLDKAITLLEKKVLKYKLLINQSGMETLLASNINDFLELDSVFKS